MKHDRKCENGCTLRATWRCEHLFFCENCKEEIILNVGVDRYQWERLSEDEKEFGGDKPKQRWKQRHWFRTVEKAKPGYSAGIERIPDGTNLRGYREVCRTTVSWEARRSDVYSRDGGRCRRCGCEAPLHHLPLAALEPGLPTRSLPAGEAMHISARKMGAGFRDDHLDNLVWGCASCHRLDPTCKFLQNEREAVSVGKFSEASQ